MFDGDYFIDWFKKLLSELHVKGIQNSIIVMDSAKYHKTLPQDTPKGNQKKAILQAACSRYDIPFEYTDLKSMLWEKLKTYIAAKIQPVVSTLAKAAGHTVLFTPPHHSDLQPIEMVWAIVKGEVGRQYTTETTFKMVLDRLNLAFENLTSKQINGCVVKSEERLLENYKYIRETENDDFDSDTDDDDDNDVGSDLDLN